MQEYIFIGFYLLISCILVRRIAAYDSFLGIRISVFARKILLIFSFEKPKISIMAVIYQIYTYIMLALFVCSRFASLDFLQAIFYDPNLMYTYALRIQLFLLLPLAILELGVCYLVNRLKQR